MVNWSVRHCSNVLLDLGMFRDPCLDTMPLVHPVMVYNRYLQCWRRVYNSLSSRLRSTSTHMSWNICAYNDLLLPGQSRRAVLTALRLSWSSILFLLLMSLLFLNSAMDLLPHLVHQAHYLFQSRTPSHYSPKRKLENAGGSGRRRRGMSTRPTILRQAENSTSLHFYVTKLAEH